MKKIFNNAGKQKSQWFSVKNQADGSVEILIYDQIGEDWYGTSGVSAKDFANALQNIPRSTEITCRINSVGGNVWDGLAIYNQLNSRRDKVTCCVDGLAASISSIIALAGKKLVMPENSMFMIHSPAALCSGDAEDMRQMADTLDAHETLLASVYASKCGKSVDYFVNKMRAETWYTGTDALKEGLCDETCDPVQMAASFDLSHCKRVPDSLAAKNKKNPATKGTEQSEDTMDRKKIIAALRARGVKVEDNISDEQLLVLVGGPSAPTEGAPTGSAAPTAPKASAPAPAPAAPSNQPALNIVDLNSEIRALRAEVALNRRDRITAVVNDLIVNRQIPEAMRERAITRALHDETILDEYRQQPAIPEPAPSAGSIVVTGDDPNDVCRGLISLRAPIGAMLRNGATNPKDPIAIHEAAVRSSQIIAKNREKLIPLMNANTVDANLKRQVILGDVIRDFARRLIPISAFATNFGQIPLQGTNTVAVPYYPLDKQGSKDYDPNAGYVFDKNSVTNSALITINKRKYQPFDFSSDDFRRQPYFNVQRLAGLKAEQLGVDVFNDVLSVVTQQNFGVPIFTGPYNSFDADDVADMMGIVDKAQWPDTGRALIIDSLYNAALCKDPAVRAVLNAGSDSALRLGDVKNLYKFGIYPCPNIPNNGQNLIGMAVFQSGILFATSPIEPAPGVRRILLNYDMVVEPQTGIAFEYRYWGEAAKDGDREVIECNYGYQSGVTAAVYRMTSQ